MRMEYVVVSYPTVRDVRMEETEETGDGFILSTGPGCRRI